MIDVEAILEQFGGETDVLLSGADAFLESYPHLLDGVQDAMDFEAIRECFAELENALDELRLDLENLIPTL